MTKSECQNSKFEGSAFQNVLVLISPAFTLRASGFFRHSSFFRHSDFVISFICLGVSSHFISAQRACFNVSTESLHSPPFFITRRRLASPETSSEISPLR